LVDRHLSVLEDHSRIGVGEQVLQVRRVRVGCLQGSQQGPLLGRGCIPWSEHRDHARFVFQVVWIVVQRQVEEVYGHLQRRRAVGEAIENAYLPGSGEGCVW